MTPLKPIENRRVRAVVSDRYILNKYCASPMSEPGTLADDAHHCYPRSLAGGGEWWIEVEEEDGQITLPIPHVVGLSREQHERVERHDAWIRLEDGIWNWYERVGGFLESPVTGWQPMGPLDPQPGYTSTSKPRKHKNTGEKRKRRQIHLHVPDDSENGGEIWKETQERIKDKLVAEGLYEANRRGKIPNYEAWIACANDWLNS